MTEIDVDRFAIRVELNKLEDSVPTLKSTFGELAAWQLAMCRLQLRISNLKLNEDADYGC